VTGPQDTAEYHQEAKHQNGSHKCRRISVSEASQDIAIDRATGQRDDDGHATGDPKWLHEQAKHHDTGEKKHQKKPTRGLGIHGAELADLSIKGKYH
jgi:hypothetical protein